MQAQAQSSVQNSSVTNQKHTLAPVIEEGLNGTRSRAPQVKRVDDLKSFDASDNSWNVSQDKKSIMSQTMRLTSRSPQNIVPKQLPSRIPTNYDPKVSFSFVERLSPTPTETIFLDVAHPHLFEKVAVIPHSIDPDFNTIVDIRIKRKEWRAQRTSRRRY